MMLAGVALPVAPVQGQVHAPPTPPVFPPTIAEEFAPAARAASAASLPSAEWIYHKSADGLDPGTSEQKMLWFMNRARTDPTAEGNWLANISDPDITSAVTFFGVDLDAMQAAFAALPAKPPAAFDIRLHDASALHSLDLIDRDAQDHAGQIAKVQSSGFSCNGMRVSVFSYTRSALHGHAALNIDWGYDAVDDPDPDGMQDPPGHREAIMGVWPYAGPGLTNVGLALLPENNNATSVGPLVFSGAYCPGGGSEHNRFIVGTVWDDLDADDEYDEGEGLGGVMVVPDSGTYFAVTGEAGGYAIPMTSSGSYTVSFYGGDMGATQVDLPVDVGSDSVLLDLKNSGPDRDGDGVPDAFDAFPDDPTETADSDGDGVGDNADVFPDDPTESEDLDGDGVGDNGDAFPGDPDEQYDSDDDGIGDNSDPYPVGHFDDVPPGHPAYHFVELLADADITAGCDAQNYCPEAAVTRAGLAVFLERALHGAGAGSVAATGAVFADVAAADTAAAYIEHLFLDGITAGCNDENFCPAAIVTRAELAVFLIRLKRGAAYTPPPASGLYGDVSANMPGADWIEQLAADGISVGCDANNFCPYQAITRDQLAVLLARTLPPL
jgi:hypothetical protein